MMKLLMEEWNKFLAEARFQRVDWLGDQRRWPEGAAEAWQKTRVIRNKWKEENRRLRKQFLAATKAAAKGEMSDEEYGRIADEHADHFMKPLGDMMVAQLKIFHQAGFVPPKVVVQGANQWREGELAKKKQAEAELATLKALGIKTPLDVAARINSGEIEMVDLMKYLRALERKKAAQQNKEE
jgi:hypothetical protein